MNRNVRAIVGLIVLALVIILLVTSSGEFFSRGIQLIDTELSGSSGHERFVRTTMDFGSPIQVEEKLLNSTDWTGVPYDMSDIEQQLGADILTTWSCQHVSSSATVWFLILQSRDVVSFHPPPVCYRSIGYNILEEDTLDIPVPGDEWAVKEWMEPISDPSIYEGTIRVKKLVVAREMDGVITEKRVVLYYFIKDGRRSMPNKVTMIRVSAMAPLHGSYDAILDLEKKIVADFFPKMFEPRSKGRTMGGWLIDEWGIPGGMVIGVMVLVPIGFLGYPWLRRVLYRMIQ